VGCSATAHTLRALAATEPPAGDARGRMSGLRRVARTAASSGQQTPAAVLMRQFSLQHRTVVPTAAIRATAAATAPPAAERAARCVASHELRPPMISMANPR